MGGSTVAVHDAVGMLGVTLVVGAYVALQLGRLDEQSRAFPLVNALGSAAVLFSLYHEFNLAATLVNAAWLAISLWSLLRARAPSPTP
jgi:hypothetical protein